MNGIAAETYARRCAEDELRAVDDEDEEPRALRERLRALVFVGLLETDVAVRILSAYGRARLLRGLGGYHGVEHDQSTQAPDPARVARCSGEIDLSGATIAPRLVTLSANRTRLAVTIRAGSGGGPGRGRRRRHHLAFLDVDEIILRDDKGRSVTAHFSGGGGGSEWHGWYGAEPGLSPDTAWVEVEGTRLALDDADAGATVTVEALATDELPTEERAHRYLEHCAQTSSVYEPAPLALVADALITCGALSADSPALTAVLGAEGDGAPHPQAYPGGGRWGSRQSQRASRGRQPVTVLVGVATPPFDGVSVMVTGLEFTPDGFQIEFDGVGPVEFGHGNEASIGTPRLAMRATDDRGGRYRGSPAQFEQGSEGFSGTIHFTPALDPNASVVDLEFNTERARAIIHVPLPPGGRP